MVPNRCPPLHIQIKCLNLFLPANEPNMSTASNYLVCTQYPLLFITFLMEKTET